jgi:hypothetical protein
MSWSFSLALVEGFLEANCLGIEPSAQSSLTHTPDQYYWPDKPTEHYRLFRFGMTCEPLTGNLGAELLTWFLEDSHARTYPLQDVETDWTVHIVDSGGRWRESLARYDPDTHSLKTAQLSLVEDWAGCSVTLPRSGLMLDGQCWELPMLGRITREIEYGFLPTPVAMDAGSGRFNTSIGGKPRPTMALMARKDLWPTPNAMLATSDLNFRVSGDGRRKPNKLGWAVGMYLKQKHGDLNPQWVEWLMGWPIGHTDLKPLATVKCPSAVQQHGNC